jgi:hypothetical protein
MWSDDRYPVPAPTLTDFLNWMPSNDTQDDGEGEEIQEIAEAAFAASSQESELNVPIGLATRFIILHNWI